MGQLEFIVSDDRTRVTLFIQGQEYVTLDAAQAEDMLRQLGNARSQLSPQVPNTPSRNFEGTPMLWGLHTVDVLKDGAPQTPAEAGAGLALRSPMFGWQLQRLSPLDCQELANWLLGQKPQTPPGTVLS